MATKKKASSKSKKTTASKKRPPSARPPIHVHVNAAGKKKPVKKNPSRRPKLSAKWATSTMFEAAKSAVIAYGGMVATREIPQMALQGQNVGTKGLLANVGTGLALTWVASMISPRIAVAVATGAALGVAQRAMSERMMPVAAVASSPASGIGDVFTLSAARDSRMLIPAAHPASKRFMQSRGGLRTVAA